MISDEPPRKKPALDDRRGAEEPPTEFALVPNVPEAAASAGAILEQLRGDVAMSVASAATLGMLKQIMMKKALLSCIDNGYRFPVNDVKILYMLVQFFLQVSALTAELYLSFYFLHSIRKCRT